MARTILIFSDGTGRAGGLTPDQNIKVVSGDPPSAIGGSRLHFEHLARMLRANTFAMRQKACCTDGRRSSARPRSKPTPAGPHSGHGVSTQGVTLTS